MNPIQKILKYFDKIEEEITKEESYDIAIDTTNGSSVHLAHMMNYSKSQIKTFRIYYEGYELFEYWVHYFDNITKISLCNEDGYLLDWDLNDFSIKEESKKDDIELILTHGKIFHYNEDPIQILEKGDQILDLLKNKKKNEDLIYRIIKTL